MRRAIEAAQTSQQEGGGPFGAVVVRGDKMIALGTNRVTPDHDPTAHAEVLAIRAACAALGTHSLAGCVLYSSCEPCPMCLGAIWWARIERVFFGNTRADAAAVGFDDAALYDEVARPLEARTLTLTPLLREEALAGFAQWRDREEKTSY